MMVSIFSASTGPLFTSFIYLYLLSTSLRRKELASGNQDEKPLQVSLSKYAILVYLNLTIQICNPRISKSSPLPKYAIVVYLNLLNSRQFFPQYILSLPIATQNKKFLSNHLSTQQFTTQISLPFRTSLTSITLPLSFRPHLTSTS